ncbi:hypothetical protein LPTSP4_23980 [Leptospira ryugenii]|uniref:Abasic site processing protein n=1 Tax=Leptospira ryugenii TaxID=1917863 RepID=A0A2P2E1X7_9LEPT|nr:SOS response-associated peptidase family protein [Leptospira ryugenii]GBF50871.1 hypothetical protein LPTSP4_23980 [Leptospira ryugenii]
MCGRFGYTLITLKDGTQKWIRLVQELPEFELEKLDSLFKTLQGTENFPSGKAPILLRSKPGYEVKEAIWGIKPDWSPKVIFNTRVEKLFSSNVWRDHIKTQRCIVPASYFLEWKSEKGTKIRYRIQNSDKSNFCFAGIYGKTDSDDQSIWFTILTQEGNSLMKEVHNTGGNQGRQPVQIEEKDLEAWLDPNIKEETMITKLIHQYPSESIQAFPDAEEPLLF